MLICAPFHSIANAPVGMPYLSSYLQQRGIACPLEDLNIKSRQYLLECPELDADRNVRQQIVDEMFTLSRRTCPAEALTWSWLNPDGFEGLLAQIKGHESEPLRDFWTRTGIEQFASRQVTAKVGSLLRNWLCEQAKRIVEKADGWIGFSSVITNLGATVFLAQQIRELDKDILLLLGGAHISSRNAGALLEAFPCFDAAIPTPAFLPMAEAIEAHSQGRSLGIIPGLWSRNRRDGTIKGEGLQRWVRLDDLPPADWSGLPIHLYQSGFMMKNSTGDFSPWYPTIPIQTSRGCSFSRCRFCHNVTDYPKYLMQTPERVVNEIRHQIETTGSRGFFFTDDEFVGSRKRTIEICKRLIELNEDVRFFCWLRLDSFDRELLDIMYEAGARQLFIGCEAIEDSLLERMNKGYNAAHALDQLRILDEFWRDHQDFIYTFNLIIDYPGETLSAVRNTLQTIADDPHLFVDRVAACCQFHLYEGTPEFNSWSGKLAGDLDAVLPAGINLPSFRYFYPLDSPDRERRMTIWDAIAEFLRFKGPRAESELTSNTIAVYD